MLAACLWFHWKVPDGEELLSFAAINDGPLAEGAAEGHDRCIIPTRPENIDRWLSPDPSKFSRSDMRFLMSGRTRFLSIGWCRMGRRMLE